MSEPNRAVVMGFRCRECGFHSEEAHICEYSFDGDGYDARRICGNCLATGWKGYPFELITFEDPDPVCFYCPRCEYHLADKTDADGVIVCLECRGHDHVPVNGDTLLCRGCAARVLLEPEAAKR